MLHWPRFHCLWVYVVLAQTVRCWGFTTLCLNSCHEIAPEGCHSLVPPFVLVRHFLWLSVLVTFTRRSCLSHYPVTKWHQLAVAISMLGCHSVVPSPLTFLGRNAVRLCCNPLSHIASSNSPEGCHSLVVPSTSFVQHFLWLFMLVTIPRHSCLSHY